MLVLNSITGSSPVARSFDCSAGVTQLVECKISNLETSDRNRPPAYF